MATSAAITRCFTCNKETSTFTCRGCSKDFCLECLPKHMQVLGQQLDEIQNDHDQFRQKLNEQKDDPKKHSLVQIIDQWEKDSINKIRQTAEECRTKLMAHTNKDLLQLENKLNNIAQEIKRIRDENKFNESHLNQFKEKFDKLREELDKSSNVLVEEQTSSLINKMVVTVSENRESPNSAASASKGQFSDRKLGCNGHACAKCGRCRDWYWRPDDSKGGKAYTKYANTTCTGNYRHDNRRYGNVYYYYHDGTSENGLGYHGLLCGCDDNRA